MEVHFAGYVYITVLINARKLEHIKIPVFCCINNNCKKHIPIKKRLKQCNRTFVENRKYVELLVAVGTPWQGDFWRQEGLTGS